MLLNNEWVNNQIKEEIKRYLETNDNENIMTKSLWDTVEAVLKQKFIPIQAYFKEQGKSQNNLMVHLKELEKGQSPM